MGLLPMRLVPHGLGVLHLHACMHVPEPVRRQAHPQICSHAAGRIRDLEKEEIRMLRLLLMGLLI